MQSIRSISAAGLAAVLLAACAQPGGPGAPAGSPPDGVPPGAVILSGTCNPQAGSYAIGRPASQALQAELITKTLAKTLRVVRPGEAQTLEFSSQRLNVEVDGAGRITALRCG